jgi:hypothetical protein
MSEKPFPNVLSDLADLAELADLAANFCIHDSSNVRRKWFKKCVSFKKRLNTAGE